MIWHRLLAAMALMLTLTACGIGGNAGERPTPIPGATVVELSEMKFEPRDIHVSAGEAVTLQLFNGGSVKHDFSIDALDVTTTLDSGNTAVVTFDAPAEPGEYEIYCNVPGHEKAGMTGTLIVD